MERLAASPEEDEASRPDRFVDLEFDADLEDALASLSDPFAEIVQLVDIDGLAYAEAAEVLGIPVGTVMSRLHRARKKIREQLRRTGAAPTHDDLVNAGRQP
jgi:RNA polymerase sigma-70 factor (ECF subfamily)